MSCTDCGRKGGCDHRKTGMFDAIDGAMARLYPTQRWDERDDASTLDGQTAADRAGALADRVSKTLKTLALVRPGAAEEFSDFVYVMCFGRQPSLIELREGIAAVADVWDESAVAAAGGVIEERHLRVALSALAPFAGIQEVALRLEQVDGDLILTEMPRTGVFDPVLLPRMQKLVGVMAELDLRNLDFGDLTAPPSGFDHSAYRERYGCDPMIANYLFYPQPASSITTTVIPVF